MIEPLFETRSFGEALSAWDAIRLCRLSLGSSGLLEAKLLFWSEQL